MAFTPAAKLALIDGNNFYVSCERVFQPWLQGPGHQVVRALFQLRESSISALIPPRPQGKPAGVPCVQLDEQMRCKVFGQPERPAMCGQLQASVEMCGDVADGGVHARAWLMRLEELTRPG